MPREPLAPPPYRAVARHKPAYLDSLRRAGSDEPKLPRVVRKGRSAIGDGSIVRQSARVARPSPDRHVLHGVRSAVKMVDRVEPRPFRREALEPESAARTRTRMDAGEKMRDRDRDEPNRNHCKERPDPSRAERRGGGGSRPFVPWCR